MFFDKVKYSTPLPGVEFRSRDLAIPAEAAKVLYEVDFQYGRDRELCLSILTNVFRGTPQITQILQDGEVCPRCRPDGRTVAPRGNRGPQHEGGNFRAQNCQRQSLSPEP